jgi:signal transduction histidine kinase
VRMEIGIADIGAMVGALIRQGYPLPVVLTTLCRLFDSTVEGFVSGILLLDRTGARVRNAAGPGLPASYLKQLEGRQVSWIEASSGASIYAKTPTIELDPARDAPQRNAEAAPAAPAGLRQHAVSPVLSLTGEPLGIFAVYQRASDRDVLRCHCALISKFTQVASAAIERMQKDEALRRSTDLLERTEQLGSTCCFSWCVETDEISWSKELCQLFELDPTDAPVTLELIADRLHSEDLPSFQEMIEMARSGVSDLECEHRVRLRDHSIRYLRVVVHRVRDSDGLLEYIGAVQDVTHRRHTEEALAKLRAELAQASKVASLGVLTAAIAHEVSQPLAGIVTNASTCRRMLAVDPPDVEGARETARRTIRDAERASEVIRRLRALFCKKGATTESLDLNEVTQEVVALSLSELERNNVTVRTELAEKLPRVQGDRVQLQQVMLNLFLNAADAMSNVDDRPRQVVIRTAQDERDHVRLSVRDTGVGFEPQRADRLFDAFYTTKSSGMGIGLSVSRSIIESHKGRMWATPNDGPGATFAFAIPCAPTDVTGSLGDARNCRTVRTSAGVTAGEHSVRRLRP